MRIRELTKIGILGVAAALTFGCASNAADYEMLKSQHESDMQRAMDMAAQANAKADEALRVANEANSRSMATDEKLNRMFQRSMMK
ncbi:hypothetical protein GCM10011348_09340 [Marinobacterium nitratireducens]|uniref:Murein lipoprotein n=1 Tax=Marinobacterium nitratireducens TaxID=518897 RepID=A0A917Z8Q7_9GAMM|nr:alanine-zipper protein [Marinobacterium nitratireducens]GGO78139.1 hypothetical protein GCM10011348_09340 [Marinobacterium nitratireducens]